MRRHPHTRRRAATSLTAVVSAALLTAACTGSDEPTGPIVAQGRVVDGDGAAVSGAQVLLVLLPSSEEWEAAGDVIEVNTVAQAASAEDGRFELRIAESERDELPSDPSAVVDFEIHVNAPEGWMSYAWSARPASADAPGVFVRADAEPPADPAAAEPVTVELDVTEHTYDDGS
ncbi:hypothetical protein [Jiangella endophytica]|uniref:hypothetical protein n=1 Tax=Jiangella endophytica TaxID=1623398 RepID=UPI000E34AB80|nr:hypothetical protein [Jiangella endophytica]